MNKYTGVLEMPRDYTPARAGMTMTIETVTPTLAADILAGNTGNRPLRKWWVKALAARIRRGEWVMSHQGVAICEDGILRDGQHRLSAVVEAGRAVTMPIFRNVPAQAFTVIDQGVKRTFSDLSDTHPRVMEACTFFAKTAYGGNTSFAQAKPILDSTIGDLATDLVDHCGTVARVFSATTFKAGCIANIILGRASKEYAFDLYRALVLADFGAMPPIGHAAVRQLAGLKYSGRSADVLARALALFDESKRDLTMLKVGEASRDAAFETIRKIVLDEVQE